ncbi:MAG: hypothetical protein ACOC56_02030 [Atribacterota bacterium]
MGLVTLYFAKMYDEKGKHIKDIHFDNFKNTFKFKNRSYNIRRKEGSYFFKKGILIDKVFYQYNISNTEPFILEKKPTHTNISPEDYNTMLESKITKDLNNLAKRSDLMALLQPKYIIGAIVVLGIIYFASTGQLTP